MKRNSFFGAVCAFLLFLTQVASASQGFGLWAAGDNYWGELGNGSIYNTNAPGVVISSNAVTAVAAGYYHALFVKTDGSLWGMGANADGQLGFQGGSNAISLPALMVSNGVATAAGGFVTSSGSGYSLWVMTNGSLWGVGNELYGELGDGSYGVGTSTYSTNVPEMVVSNGVSLVAAGLGHTLFVKTDGSLWAMGNDQEGQLGDGQPNGFDYNYTNRPQMIVSGTVTTIAAGAYHSLFIETNGSLWGMGQNAYGQLGLGNLLSYTNRPAMIDSNVTAIAGGYNYSLYVKNDGTLWGMGDNTYGQLGTGTTNDSFTPIQIPVSNVVSVAANQYASAFIKSDGSLWTMGNNGSGALGASQTNSQSLVPVEVTASNVAAVAYGASTLYFLQTIVPPPSQIGVSEAGVAITDGQTNAINFGNVITNQTGPTLTFTVTNAGGQTLDLTGFAIPTGYTLGVNPPTTVAPASHATFTVQLTANTVGTYSGDVILTNSAITNGTFAFPITGSVTVSPPPAQISVSEASLVITNGETNAINYGTILTNGTGAILTYSVTNAGGQTLDLSGFSVPAGFTSGTNLPTSVAAGTSAVFTIQFTASSVGTYAGNVVITNSAPTNGVFTFAVAGAVTVPVGSPAITLQGNLAFGVVSIGSSAQSILSISNSGNAVLHVTNIIVPGGFAASWSNGPIASGATQPVTITFSPLNAIGYSGTVTVISDATNSSSGLLASGFGADPSLVLTVLTEGAGTVTPNLSGKSLKAGTKYTLTAVPTSTSIFQGWTGSLVTNANPLTFVMSSNMVLQANFVTNPFLADKGSFNGLFFGTNGVTEQTSGMLKGLSITPKATYTASLLVNGTAHPLTGKFSIDGLATNTVKRPAAQGGNLTVYLTLTATNTIPLVIGTVVGTNDNGTWSSFLLADLATNTIPAGQFTLLLPADTNNEPPLLSPGGAGYALITNSVGPVKNPAAANAKITGALADGTAFNQTVPVAEDGSVPVYVNLYGGKGLLLGWINLNLTNTAAVESSSLTWIHPTEKAGLYKAGFTNVLLTNQIQISAWTNPPQGLTGLTNFSILDNIYATNAQTNVLVAVASNGKISGPEVTGTLTLKTGLVKMTFGKGAGKVSASGVLLPNAATAAGYIVTKTNSEAFQLK